MLTKRLLTISLLFPLMAISASAQAGSTITDARYWPNTASQGTQSLAGSQSHFSSALAFERSASAFESAKNAGSALIYQGGPKGR
jgi:hypothetical protein